MIIDKEFESLIPPLTNEEYSGLEASIIAEGCRDALVCWNDILIDGHNRYKICSEHNIPFNVIQKEFVGRNEALLWIMRNQLSRRNLNNFQRIEIVRKCEEAVKSQAKERQGMRNDLQTSGQNFPEVEQQIKRATDELGNMAGVSRKTYEHAVEVLDNAPEKVINSVRNGDISINKAYEQIKRSEKEAKREAVRQENSEKIKTLSSPLEAQGLFQTIVIDPAWDFSEEGDNDQFGRGKPDYQVMSIQEIETLPIAKIADENCHLYLWITNRSLPKGFRLLDAWGFRYVTCLTWVKPYFGIGNYFRGQTEHILFGVKGSQPLKRHDIGTYFTAPRGDRHSAKPDEFYSLVESCSYAPYIDIFGRKERMGWSVWGENS